MLFLMLFISANEPPILYVLRADVSVELPAQYRAPRPGVPRAERLAGDVEVLPWAKEFSGHWVQIVPTMLDPVIVVIATGESVSASGLYATSLPEFKDFKSKFLK